MASYSYDRLTALDNTFLLLERPNAYMHVASTMVFEPGPLGKEDGGIEMEKIRKLVSSILHMIPRYRQKLQYIPFTDQPVWVDDDSFNIDYHLRHTALPRPGSSEQLKRLSSRIMQNHLDRRRPLWEMWVVEGLEDNRWALISKVHHCMIDGVSGVDLMKILMSHKESYEIHETPTFVPRPLPLPTELVVNELLHYAAMPLAALRGLTTVTGELRNMRRDVSNRLRMAAQTVGGAFNLPSETPLNRPIGPHRRFDWMTMKIDDVKAIRRSLGGSLNDVVLTIVSGAVRRFMQRRLVDPARLDFRVMAPVSVRTEEEKGALGNRVSAWIVDIPLAEPDPRKRLSAISRTTGELKQNKSAVGAELLTQVAEWTPSTILSLAARNGSRFIPFNLVVTNVPGPQIPMYFMGARMIETFPHVPLIDNLGLGIALMSYDGNLCWRFNADYDLLPDLKAFITGVQDSFEELMTLAEANLSSGPRSSGGSTVFSAAQLPEAAGADSGVARAKAAVTELKTQVATKKAQ